MHFCYGKGMKIGVNRFSALNLQHVDQVTCFSLRKSQDTLNDDSKHLNLFPASCKNSNAVLNCKSSFYFLLLAIAYKEEIISTGLDQVWLVVIFLFPQQNCWFCKSLC